MKILKLIFILILSINLSSSFKIVKTYDFNDFCITFDNIFNIDEDDYYIFFYLEYCLSCKYLIDEIKERRIYEKRIIFYVDLLSLPLDQLDYQKDNLFVNTYFDIHLNSAPTLFEIKENKIEKQMNSLVEIEEEFNEVL